MPILAGAAVDLQVQADGTIKDMVSGGLATIVRNSLKYIVSPTTGLMTTVPNHQLYIEAYPMGAGYWALVEPFITNYARNSSFEVDTNGDGLCDNFSTSTTTVNPITVSRVNDGLHGSYSQRLQYVGVDGDTSKRFRLTCNAAVGSFSAGMHAVGSMWVKGALVGCNAYLVIRAMNSAGVEIGSLTGSPFVVTSTWTRRSVWYGALGQALPANTSYCRLDMYVDLVDSGDTADVQIDCIQLEQMRYTTSWIPTPSNATAARNQDVVTFPWSFATRPTDETLIGVSGFEWGITANKTMFGLRGAASTERGGITMYQGSASRIQTELLPDSPATYTYASRGFISTPANMAPAAGAIRRTGRSLRAFAYGQSTDKIDSTATADITTLPRWFEIGMYRGSGNMANGFFHRAVYIPSAPTDQEVEALIATIMLGTGNAKRRRSIVQTLGGMVRG